MTAPGGPGSGATPGDPATPSGAPRPAPRPDPGPNWAQRQPTASPPTTVLPGGSRAGAAGGAGARPAPGRTTPARPGARDPRAAARPALGRTRRARLALRRIDPWSVFLFSLVASVFVGIAFVVAAAVLYAVLGALGVNESLNELFAEVTGGSPTEDALLTSGRIIGGAAVIAAVNIVFLTLLATLGSMLYNLCASFTGGIEVTLGDRD